MLFEQDEIWRYYDVLDILFKTKDFVNYSNYVKNLESKLPIKYWVLTGSRYKSWKLPKLWIKNFVNFSTLSKLAIAKFEYRQKYHSYDFQYDDEIEYLINLYLMQAKYYYQYEKDEKPKKSYKKALAVLDKIFKLDKNNKEAILLKDSVSKSL